MNKLLVATTPEYATTASVFLKPHFDVVVCTSMEEALAALEHEIDLILCSFHFANGCLYEFLSAARAHTGSKSIPFLIVHATPSTYLPPVQKSIEIAAQAMGADQFVDMEKWRAEMGDEMAFEKLLTLLHQSLSR